MRTGMRIALFGLLAVLTLNSVPVMAATYDIDTSHSSVNFQVKHMAISKANGSFGEFAGSFVFAEGEPETWQVEAVIQVNSIDTGNDKRDGHLLAEDFFAAEQFPTMIFKSTGVEMSSAEEGTLTGELSMHGVTKSLDLALEYNGSTVDPWGNARVGFSLSGKINRKDWGLSYSKTLETGGLVVGEIVKISLEIEGIAAK